MDVAADTGVELFGHLSDAVVRCTYSGGSVDSGEGVAEGDRLGVDSAVPHHFASSFVQLLLPEFDVDGGRLVAVLEPLRVVTHPGRCVINKVIRNRFPAVPHTLTHYPLEEDFLNVPAHARTHFKPGVENEGEENVSLELGQVSLKLVHVQI